MPFSRYLFFPTKQRPGQCLNLLQRLGPSKRVQSSCFSKSTSQNHWKRPVPQVEVELWAPRFFVIPAAVLGFVGLAAFVHYNDERRAVPKGFLICVTQNVALWDSLTPIVWLASSWNGTCLGWNTEHALCGLCGWRFDYCQGSDSVNVKGPIIGGPFTLVNTENKVVTEKDFLGNWVLLYFGYTFSPDVGPEQLKLITKALNTLGRETQVSAGASKLKFFRESSFVRMMMARFSQSVAFGTLPWHIPNDPEFHWNWGTYLNAWLLLLWKGFKESPLAFPQVNFRTYTFHTMQLSPYRNLYTL
ncbi:hypothetical protein NC652_013274 [Populus alba x Populus x berolinensis]|nr:hypothetical protein NC652_013274 [Populus alba x Populus x berolinensis]